MFYERCPQAQRAISFYRQKYRAHREAMNLPGPVPRVWYACDAARRRAHEWLDRAAAARQAFTDWRAYHYNWRTWLPHHWVRVGSCETGYGGPPNWHHANSSYQGAFGFATSSWDSFVGSADPKAGPYPHEAWQATPRQQYEVALAIYRRYGMSGWGCKG